MEHETKPSVTDREGERLLPVRVLYGTRNTAKLSEMRERLKSLPIVLTGLADLKQDVPDIAETGSTPLENARQKAEFYYRTFHMPVFSCDSGLYFDRVPEDIQPGVYVRRVHGKNLTDEEMIAYYSGLARKYGNLKARYKNAVCFVLDDTHRYEAMTPSMESREFLLTDRPHPVREQGFPLDSLSVDAASGLYFQDLGQDAWEKETDGMLEFFQEVFGKLAKVMNGTE